MANIGSLAVLIGGNTQGLEVALNKTSQLGSKVGQTLRSLGQSVGAALDQGLIGSTVQLTASLLTEGGKLLHAVPIVGPALNLISSAMGSVVSAGGQFLQFIRGVWSGVNDFAKNARQAGVSLQNFAALQIAAGGSSEALEKGLVHLNRIVGEAQTGNKIAENSFKALGIEVDSLAGMDTGDVFAEVANKIQGINDPTLRAKAAFDIFGKAGGQLAEALRLASGGLDDLKQRADKRGLLLTDSDAAMVREASRALDDLDKTFAGVKQQIAVGLAPVLSTLVDQFDQNTTSVKGLAGASQEASKMIAYGGAAAAEAWKGLSVVWKFLQLGLDGLIYGFSVGLQKLLDLAGQLPDSLGGKEFRDKAEYMRGVSQNLFEGLAKSKQDVIDNAANFGSSFTEVDRFFAQVEQKQKQAQKNARDTAAANKEANQAANNYAGFERIQNVIKDNMTPLEKFSEKLTELQKLRKLGLNDDDFGRAASKAFSDLEKTLQPARLAGALEEGSAGALSAINLTDAATRGSNDPTKQMQDLLRQIKDANQQQLQEIRKQTEFFKNLKGKDL